MKEISETKIIHESNNAVKILKGIVISIIITFILLFIFAIVLTFTNVEESTIGPVVIGITAISILARKLYDYKFNKEKWNIKWRIDSDLFTYCLYI